MSAQVMCPTLKCRKILSIPEESRGKVVRCQHCQTLLKVPEHKLGAGKSK